MIDAYANAFAFALQKNGNLVGRRADDAAYAVILVAYAFAYAVTVNRNLVGRRREDAAVVEAAAYA